MRTKAILSIVGGLALALGVTQAAFAQTPHLCVLGASDGTATITPNLTASPSSGATHFFFKGPCPGTSQHVCSNGTLTAASCSGNLTAGTFKLCPHDCSGAATGALTCNNGLVIETPTSSGSFNGLCAGPLCAGGGSNLQYSLLFDQATSQKALAQCPAPPVGTGTGIGSASFGGPIVYEY